MLSQSWGVKDMVSVGVEGKINRLESIVEQIGEAVLATTETIERLADKMENLSVQVEQQGYQILALCDAVQTLAESQDDTLQKLNHLTHTLDRLMELIQGTPEG